MLVPLLSLVVMEVGLRLAGFGHPTSFFLKARQGGEDVFVENPRFGWRFFPPHLARVPQPLSLPARKTQGTIRVFVLGESAAMGDPEPAYGFQRFLEVLLAARFPERRFEVVNASMTAINSHVLRVLARECARREGDIWLLYLGHNEVVGPFGPGTIFGRQQPGLWLTRALLGLRATRLGQLAGRALEALPRNPRAPEAWAGLEMFLGRQVRHDDPRLRVVREQFARNLEDILGAGRRAGVAVVLSTVAANQRDCAPFGSRHRPDLAPDAAAAWERDYQAGLRLQAEGRPGDALAALQRAEQNDADFAELQFRLARLLEQAGRSDEARACYARACDLDTLRFRADSALNGIIRQTASRPAPRAVQLLDADAAFGRHSTNGLAGRDWFFEHVHFRFEGNYLLARLAAEEVAGILRARGGAFAGRDDWLSFEDCAGRLALTSWQRARVLGKVLERLPRAPFPQQANHAETFEALRAEHFALERASQAAGLPAQVEVHRQALKARPLDWVLHSRLADLLEAAGDQPAAAQAWETVTRLLPHHPMAHYRLGNLQAGAGQWTAATDHFHTALRLNPDLVEAMNSLGFVHLSRSNYALGLTWIHRALKVRPQYSDAWVNLGWASSLQGETEAAQRSYYRALECNSNSLPAHRNLARLLSRLDRPAEAALHYAAVCRLQPQPAAAHTAEGDRAFREGRLAEALGRYLEAARLRPDDAQARYDVGKAYARLDLMADAAAQFAEAARLKPDFAQAHFNLAVALARQQKLPAALAELRRTLELEPNHPQAGTYLRELLALESRAPGPR
jgi:tetratricopeptide (TPR) repeat protein